MVYMGGPCAIEGYEATCVDCPAEDVFWREVSFVPCNGLL